MSKPVRRVENYLDPTKNSKSGEPRGVSTIQSVEQFRPSRSQDIWTDPYYAFPADPTASYDWEVWLRGGDVERFKTNAAILGIQVSKLTLLFPDREVVVARAPIAAVERAVDLLDSIAELRAAPQFDSDFHKMRIPEQAEWTHELAGRLVPPERDDVALCIFDSGVAWAHPLLRPSISSAECHAVLTWTPDDRMGHGTWMAGVASFGEHLGDALASSEPFHLPFPLESVKIIDVGTAHTSLTHRGAILREAPLHPEREAPFRTRVFTVTITGVRSNEGRPTAWSSALDQICAGVDDDPGRLVFVSAGNHDHQPTYAYPEDNLTDGVQDPAQAWNAVCVGAITDRVDLDQTVRPGWSPIASAGDMSPHTTVGRLWEWAWPNKPDMVMEGGNMAAAPAGQPERVEELELLTTNIPDLGWPLLTSAGGTSPAAVLAGRYATRIRQEYTSLWPETVRALLIHSCRWTTEMRERCNEGTRRQKVNDLLRTFGHGRPDLRRALHSAGHALTLVLEDTIQPFKLEGSTAKSNELRLHDLPWPESALEALGTTTVRLRVTLSYFVEPGPGDRGWGSRYRYPSHNLRFAVKTADETDAAFEKRISLAARSEGDKGKSFPSDASEWVIGTDNRDRGSVHSDVWEGPASKLTGRGRIAVFPVIGWWRERKHLGQVERKARYALIVSIETDDVEAEVEGQVLEVDFYSEVASKVGVAVEIDV
ncbi:MAG: S8 family peptidase [Myxococcota bacterium]